MCLRGSLVTKPNLAHGNCAHQRCFVAGVTLLTFSSSSYAHGVGYGAGGARVGGGARAGGGVTAGDGATGET